MMASTSPSGNQPDTVGVRDGSGKSVHAADDEEATSQRAEATQEKLPRPV